MLNGDAHHGNNRNNELRIFALINFQRVNDVRKAKLSKG